MGIDFSKLDSIGRDKKPQAARVEPIRPDPLQHKIDERIAYGRALEGITKNIKVSEALRVEILKGAQAGDDIEIILEKALRCIYLMTDDRPFYEQAIAELF